MWPSLRGLLSSDSGAAHRSAAPVALDLVYPQAPPTTTIRRPLAVAFQICSLSAYLRLKGGQALEGGAGGLLTALSLQGALQDLAGGA